MKHWFVNLDIWLVVHHSITFLLLPTWYTNFLFIHINYIKLNSSTCFERNPLIIRKSTTQIVHMQPLVLSLSASNRLVQPLSKDSPSSTVAQDGHLQRVTIPEAAYVQFASLTSWCWAEESFLSGCTRRLLAESDDTRGCICTICVVDLLMMSGLRSKHVEEFNFM